MPRQHKYNFVMYCKYGNRSPRYYVHEDLNILSSEINMVLVTWFPSCHWAHEMAVDFHQCFHHLVSFYEQTLIKSYKVVNKRCKEIRPGDDGQSLMGFFGFWSQGCL